MILPFLDILGFSAYDPTKVLAEYSADLPGVKAQERVDYALFCHGSPVMFVEAKAYSVQPENHSPQLARYFNSMPEVTVGVITNGRKWKFFTDLENKNVMDEKPFLTIDLLASNDSELIQLYQFRHDQFEPEKLRSLAEENTYFTAFSSVIRSSLRNIDIDFVRFVASKSSISRQLTIKFLESITPIVKQAVEKTVSDMVVSGLSVVEEPEPEEPEEINLDEVDEVHPDNPKIITTVEEKRVYTILKEILDIDDDLVLKDTETYCAYLYEGKTNRWVLRYRGDKKNPDVELILKLADEMISEIKRAGLEVTQSGRIIIHKPEDLYRISGLIFDCLNYCKDDDNFRVARKDD
ncbi:MAG: type I restriction endonuclease subunit R [Desulfovibrionales bacterium]|nr:type I restriction endonuclease subunit R [Desulfovibrionales bacterium]